MADRDVQRFDRWAPYYDRSWTQRLFFRPVHQGVLDLAAVVAPHLSTIVDAGCGTGALLRLAAHRFPEAELVGADPSAEMIRMAKGAASRGGRVRFVQAHAEELPLPSGHFDLALSTISFHHWADQSKGLREVSRVLASGGVFLLADHFVISWRRAFFVGRRRKQRFHTRGEIAQMLREAGFTRCRCHALYKLGPLRIVDAVSARKD
jgi:SAM-dependent methyltransferase